jgi:hypothetical protein
MTPALNAALGTRVSFPPFRPIGWENRKGLSGDGPKQCENQTRCSKSSRAAIAAQVTK